MVHFATIGLSLQRINAFSIERVEFFVRESMGTFGVQFIFETNA